MQSGLTVPYFIFMALSVLLSLLLLILATRRKLSVSDEKQKVWIYYGLFGYYFVNFLGELIVHKILLPGTRNHFIYAIVLQFGSLSLFLFFTTVVRNRIFTRSVFIVWLFTFCVFLWYKLWHPDAILGMFFSTDHYAIVAIASVLFLGNRLLKPRDVENRFYIRFGILFAAYYLFSIFLIPFMVTQSDFGLNRPFVYLINDGIIVAYYLISVIFLFQDWRVKYRMNTTGSKRFNNTKTQRS